VMAHGAAGSACTRVVAQRPGWMEITDQADKCSDLISNRDALQILTILRTTMERLRRSNPVS
jgi:hypothetical protein